jgi:hypothetical protein
MGKYAFKKNNFDVSSTGVNIESSCYYDTWLSQINFKENFESLDNRDRRGDNHDWYFVDCGNLPDSSKIEFELKGSREDLIKFIVAESYYERDDVETWQESELQEYAIDRLSETPKVYNFESLNDSDLKDTGLELIPNKAIESIFVRGYSQGDYARIFYSPDDIESVWGKLPNDSELRESFRNYCFDSPIYASLTINGTEYNYHESPEYKSEYEWDKDSFIAWVSKESGIDKEVLSQYLPEYPEYN